MCDHEQQTHPDVVVTIIHGTWGRTWAHMGLPTMGKGTPRWFEKGSEFTKNLHAELKKQHLTCEIKPFLWSGANSIGDRNEAAKQLALEIHQKIAAHPNSIQLLIAHSHGGNVAMTAVDGSMLNHQKIFVATLATPFVKVISYNHGDKSEFIIFNVSATISAMLYLYFMNQMRLFQEWYTSLLGASVVLNSLVSAIIWAIIWMGITFSIVWIFYKLRALARRWSFEKVRVLHKSSLSKINTVTIGGVLVLRAIDDEASLTLASGAIGNRLSSRFARWSLSLFVSSLVIVPNVLFIQLMYSLEIPIVKQNAASYAHSIPIIGAILFLSDMALITASQFFVEIPIVKQDAESFEYLIPIIGAILFLSYVSLTVASQLFKAVYGKEMVYEPWKYEISSHSAPDFKGNIEISTLPPDRAKSMRLRHRIYDHRAAVEHIVSWLCANAPGVANPGQRLTTDPTPRN